MRRAVCWQNNGTNRQTELAGELEVPLIAKGNGHDRAGSVPHQDVISNPDRDPLVIDRVDRVRASEDSGPDFLESSDIRSISVSSRALIR